MSRRSTQQKQIDFATHQIATGLAALFRSLIAAAPATPAQPAKRRGRPPAIAHQPKRGRGRPPKASRKPRRKRSVSAEARKQFQLQGAYMGLARQLTDPQKAKLKKLRQGKGYPAAIAAARKLLKSAA